MVVFVKYSLIYGDQAYMLFFFLAYYHFKQELYSWIEGNNGGIYINDFLSLSVGLI